MSFPFLLSGFALLLSSFFTAGTLKPENSSVRFEISNFKVNTVEGRFSDLEGTAVFDPGQPEAAQIALKVPVSSINTGIEKRDTHLQAPEYFDAARYPYISFKSTGVNKTGKGFMLRGNLRIKGITKHIEVPASYEAGGLRCTFAIDRYAYKVGDSGSFTIGREVEIEVFLAFD